MSRKAFVNLRQERVAAREERRTCARLHDGIDASLEYAVSEVLVYCTRNGAIMGLLGKR